MISKKNIFFIALFLLLSFCFSYNINSVFAACTETGDVGKDASTLGTINFNGYTYTDRCDALYPKHVLEYYCDETGTGRSQWILCSSNCSNGICPGGSTTTPTTPTTPSCTSNWQASAWSTCSGGVQTKTYSDANNCATPSSAKPANETQSCNNSVLVNIYGNGVNGANGPIVIRDGSNRIGISWNSTGAEYCIASNSSGYSNNWTGEKNTSGYENVDIPTAGGSYIYTVKCFSSSGASTQSNLTINILTPKTSLTVTGPTSVAEGGSTTIAWTSENVQSCRASGTGFVGSISGSGSRVISYNFNPHIYVSTTINYSIVCVGNNGETVSALADVEVLPMGSPTVDIKANGSNEAITIKKGQPLSLSWTSSMMYLCEISGDDYFTGLGTSGSQVIDTSNKSGNVTYRITCRSNSGATAYDDIVINFSPENYSSIDLKVVSNNSDPSDGPISVIVGTSVTLSWNPVNVSSCMAGGNWTGIKNSTSPGFENITMPTTVGSFIHSISCQGSRSLITDIITINTIAVPSNCTSNWQAGAWSNCINGIQTKTYSDANNCATPSSAKLANETRNCTASTTCTDSDNGKEYSVLGTLNYNGLTYTDRCDTRYTNYLLEYYCDSAGLSKSEWVSCPGACENGICKALASCSPNWQIQDYWSECLDGQQRKSYVDLNKCSNITNKPTDQVQSCGFNCYPNWQASAWSACTNGKQTRSYTDTNNCGVIIDKPANEVKDCNTQQSCVMHKDCQDRYQNCYYACSNSQCAQIDILFALKPYPDCSTATTPTVPPTTPPTTTCTDSDNGKDPSILGILNYKGITYKDSCDSRYTNYVLEYYCNSAGEGKTEWVSCPTGCLDGVCKASSTPNYICVDERSGINYDMKDLITSLGQTITQVTVGACNTLFNLINIFR